MKILNGLDRVPSKYQRKWKKAFQNKHENDNIIVFRPSYTTAGKCWVSEAYKSLKKFNCVYFTSTCIKFNLMVPLNLSRVKISTVVHAWQFFSMCFTLTFLFFSFLDTRMLSIVFATFRIQERQLKWVLRLKNISPFKGYWHMTFILGTLKIVWKMWPWI